MTSCYLVIYSVRCLLFSPKHNVARGGGGRFVDVVTVGVVFFRKCPLDQRCWCVFFRNAALCRQGLEMPAVPPAVLTTGTVRSSSLSL